MGRRDKIDPRSGLALRNEIAAWAGAFGIREFDLYVGGKEPLDVQGIPGEPPALVVGPSIKAPLSPVIRARVARELVAMSRGTTVARSRDDVTIAAIVVAACGIAEVPIEHPPYAVLAEIERLIGKAIARKTRKAIGDPCRAIVAARAEPRAWSKRVLASHDRIAVIASGDPAVVLCEVLGVPAERLAQAVMGNAARRGAPALRAVPAIPAIAARSGARGPMTDDKKVPDDLGEVDWDSALSDWGNNFVPEVAKDVVTDKRAALSGQTRLATALSPAGRPPAEAEGARRRRPLDPPG